MSIIFKKKLGTKIKHADACFKWQPTLRTSTVPLLADNGECIQKPSQLYQVVHEWVHQAQISEGTKDLCNKAISKLLTKGDF